MIKNKGFTLIELLVVIAIISMLAGQLLPALSTAREKGRQANCINNLHQFSLAIEMYYQDYEDYPPWLSVLYPSYLDTPEIFICLTDMDRGKTGHGHTSYPETNDIPPDQIPGGEPSPEHTGGLDGFGQRNPEITANSYVYEFSPNECNWFMDSGRSETELAQANSNGDDFVSWREAKLWQASTEGHKGQVPIVRCFWHHLNHEQKVLNLAYRDYNVFTSGPEWEISSY
jgi:prepilin-type N-terminal cleavage/methylation domain-containing protein